MNEKNYLLADIQAPAQPPAKNRAPDLSAITAYFNRQLARQRQDIAKLRDAIRRAEEGYLPVRVELIRTYNDLILDAHLTALMDQRKANILSRKYTLFKGSQDLTKNLDHYWFYKFLEYAWEAQAFGYSLIGLTGVEKNQIVDVRNYERHLVEPVSEQYLPNPYVVSGIDLNSDMYKDWYVLVKQPDDLGFLAKAGFHVLSKKFVFTSWDEYAMVFGVPIRVAKIDATQGSGDKEKMSDDLASMGPAGVLVLDKSEDFQLHNASGSTSNYQVFMEQINARNRELSKLVVGQTMTTDDGSSRSQAEVHERVSNNITSADLRWIKHVVNSQLLPRLAKLRVIPDGCIFEWEQDDLLTLMQQKEVDDMLLRNGYRLPPEYIDKKYGVPVVEAPPPPKTPPQLQAAEKGQPTTPQLSIHKAANVFKAAGSAYAHKGCGCGEATNSEQLTIFDDEYLERVLERFFQGNYLRNKLPDDLYFQTANYLFQGVAQGFGGQPIKFDWGTPNRGMIEALKANTYIFSAAKTYQQRQAYNSLLKTPDGRVKTWNEYRRDALILAKDYNQRYLKAEYQAATGQARMASLWVDIEANKELFPLLKYVTVGDANVRETHRRLDGIVRPVDDPFWDRYMPKNGWGCRCDVEQLESDDEPESDMSGFKDLPESDQPKAFQFNPGKKRMVFDQAHPYFKIEDVDRDWAKDNFGLPLPEPEFELPKVTGITPNGTPVSASFNIKSPEIKDRVEYSLKLIDQIHGDGVIPELPITFESDMKGELGYFNVNFPEIRPVKINLSKGIVPTIDTILHEVGHLLDAASTEFKTFGTYSSDNPLFDLVRNDLIPTTPIKKLIKLHGVFSSNPRNSAILESINYLLDPAEIFARAYHQFILHRSGLDYRNRLISESYKGTLAEFEQWNPTEFQKIVPKFELSLRNLGWIK